MTIVTRRREVLTAGLALGLAGLLPMPGFAQQSGDGILVRHARGETRLTKPVRKVLVFDMAALDTLDSLGVPVAGVPTGQKPAHLAKYNGAPYAPIGTLFEPDYEAVNAAEPDLIIVGGRSAPKYAELAAIAPTIDMTVRTDSFIASAVENAQTLGRIFGKDAEVDAKVKHLRASITDLKATAAAAGKGLLILTTGGKVSAYGPGSRFGLLHTDYGVRPAVETLEVANHGQAVSFEFILQANPDWLFVIDRDAAIGREGQSARQLLDNDIVRRTTAWQKGQVAYLNAGNWYLVGGGLAAMQQDVDDIKAALSGKS
ncbi:siderophore ABC transporter substrate-binding protein [Azospirillum picis]|uniref:Iron complex transport system substrate-binding protein n=1 Tax=Azospirillum picis TaxID=488438 RepID=A0ABU0MLN1_9PROT|nr:siderophore ABC transporter substrate-binding protein [Azospirillum picis]MBP2301048.1 iron complex transport system substrate-binding protein [Azospirillum picis]MDQ0534332.1 iron complex transport system substrate-binding protein [Azospirillum picis]